MPVFSSSSRQRMLARRLAGAGDAHVGLLDRHALVRATSTDGNGTASTVNGPVMRSLSWSTAGWSYSVSWSACAAMDCVHAPSASPGGPRGRHRRPRGAASASRPGKSNGTSHSCKFVLLAEVQRLPLAPAFGRRLERAFGWVACAALRSDPPAPPRSSGAASLVDRVDLGVVGDRLQRDVRHGLVDEAALQPFMRILAARSSRSWRSSAAAWPASPPRARYRR